MTELQGQGHKRDSEIAGRLFMTTPGRFVLVIEGASRSLENFPGRPISQGLVGAGNNLHVLDRAAPDLATIRAVMQ